MTANVAVATQEKGNEPEREDMNADRYMIKRSGVNRNGQWTEYEFTEDEFKSRLGVEERGEFDINQGYDNGKPVVYVIFGDPSEVAARIEDRTFEVCRVRNYEVIEYS